MVISAASDSSASEILAIALTLEETQQKPWLGCLTSEVHQTVANMLRLSQAVQDKNFDIGVSIAMYAACMTRNISDTQRENEILEEQLQKIRSLGNKTALDDEVSIVRASTLMRLHRYHDAAAEYERVLPRITHPTERAMIQMRLEMCTRKAAAKD